MAWFKITIGFSFAADGSFLAFTCCSQPRIRPFLEVIGFDFFKIISIHFRKLHHHTRYSSVIWAPSASLCHQSLLHPVTTCQSVSHTCLQVDFTCKCVSQTHRRVDNPAPCVTASTAIHSCCRSPMVLCEWPPPRQQPVYCSLIFFAFPSFLWAVKDITTIGFILIIINVFFAAVVYLWVCYCSCFFAGLQIGLL
jgi:hypothetical protein